MRKTIQSLKKKLRGPTKSAAGTPSHPTLNELLRAAEISIRLLKELSDTVPFIGSAASGAIFIIEQCKKYARNSKDFKDLLGSLETLKNLVSPYQDGNLPLKAMESIKQFDSVISDIRKEVESLESTGRISQFVNGSDNQDRVKDIIQRVKEAVDRVMLASMLGVSRGVEEVSYSLEEVFRGVNEITLAQSLLSLNPVHSARYNCVDRDQCLDGTRVTVLDDIEIWFETGKEQVFWLNGAAGMGKTTIALSMAHRLSLSNQRSLMATFFCSRDSVDRKNSGLIFPTLACQLASQDRNFQDALLDVLSRYPYIGQALPHEQVQRLIVEPLQHIKPPTPIAFVIDALDECDGERASEKILLALLQHAHSAPSLKVFVSCRPAAYVEALLSSGEHRRMFKLHHVLPTTVNGDLRLFYRQRLEEIRDMKKLQDWPPGELIEKLVRQAAGLFIFAVTVCKYISAPGDTQRRLQYIANLPKGDYNDALSVDILYTEVLSAALQKIPDDHDRRSFARLLASVMLVQVPLTVDTLGHLLDIKPVVVYDLLRDVHPILSVPDESGTLIGETVHTFHASFSDYMSARDRVGEKVPLLYIVPAVQHLEMALCCLRCMNKELKRILPFSERHSANHEIQNLNLLIETHISSWLRYAVLHWVDHLSSKDAHNQNHPVIVELKIFASTKLLFWLECLSLLDASESAIQALLKGKDWLMATDQSSLDSHFTVELLADAYHAVNDFFPVVRDFGVHLYLSFLLFIPHETNLYRHYSHHLPSSWKTTGSIRKTWNPLLSHTRTSPFANTIAFSPDERRITFVGSSVCAFDILSTLSEYPMSRVISNQEAWDPHAIPGVDAAFPSGGVNLQPSMSSVVWLPSGVIVTCCTILSVIQKPHRCHCYLSLWDSETGDHIRLLFQTSEATNMFLPLLVTSASFRRLGLSTPSSLVVWNTENWDKLCSFVSPAPFYHCFALSDDHYLTGREVRAISDQSTISILDINAQSVASVFSNGGQTLVLCSVNGLIEVWNVFPKASKLATYSLPRHAEALPSVASVHDCVAISFGSEVHVFTLVHNCLSFKARFRSITPLFRFIFTAISPSGQYIACHDEQGVTHIWSTADPGGNSDFGWELSPSLAYVADTQFCVSAEVDGRLSVWDCDTSTPIQTWNGLREVLSVAVSPNGKFIASSGRNGTQVWSLLQIDAKPELEVEIIPIPEPDLYQWNGGNAVTFSPDSMMLAILAGPIVEIWGCTKDSEWRKYTTLETGDDYNISFDTFMANVDDDPLSMEAHSFDYDWLLHHCHNVAHRDPTEQCRRAFRWIQPRFMLSKSIFWHSQLYFSLHKEYILAPTGIFNISTGEQMESYRDVPYFHTKLESEKYKFWTHEKMYYRRDGVLKTFHPDLHNGVAGNWDGWILDADGRRAFWLPKNLIRNLLSRSGWHSRASSGDWFAFVPSRFQERRSPMFVHVPNVT